MEVLDRAAAVSPDGRSVVFILSTHGRDVGCAIARDADPAQILKTFENGRNRIVAVAQRKLLVRPGDLLWLAVDDFATRQPTVA